MECMEGQRWDVCCCHGQVTGAAALDCKSISCNSIALSFSSFFIIKNIMILEWARMGGAIDGD